MTDEATETEGRTEVGGQVDSLVSELLETFNRHHHYSEDCWYTCPKHPKGCCNDAEGDDCNCGADRHNAKLQEFAAKLQARLSR